jgi:hypothetical protein
MRKRTGSGEWSWRPARGMGIIAGSIVRFISPRCVSPPGREQDPTRIRRMTPTPAHDAAGNMTRVPIPGDWQGNRLGDFELTFDAWNRLVAVEDGSESECEVVDLIQKTLTGSDQRRP